MRKKTELCPGIGLGLPFLSKRPMRGPATRAPATQFTQITKNSTETLRLNELVTNIPRSSVDCICPLLGMNLHACLGTTRIRL